MQAIQRQSTKQKWSLIHLRTWLPAKKQQEEESVGGASIQIFDSVGNVDKSLLWLFEMVSSLAVLLIAFGLITSQTNVQTHGQILSDNEWMQQAWAWTQNIAIDMSLLGAIIRACVYWLEKERLKAFLYTLLSGLLLFTAAIVSNVEAVQQSIEHLSLADAYGKVIFPVSVETLTAVRSLAIVLILVAHAVQYVSWYHARYRARKAGTMAPVGQPHVAVPQTETEQVTMTQVLEAVTQMQQQTLATVQQMARENFQAMTAMNQQALQETAAQISRMTVQAVGETLDRFAETVVLPDKAMAESLEGQEKEGDENLLGTEPVEPGRGIHSLAATAVEKRYKEAIKALLLQEPGLTDRDIVERVGCSLRTANRWKVRVQKAQVTKAKEAMTEGEELVDNRQMAVPETEKLVAVQDGAETESLTAFATV